MPTQKPFRTAERRLNRSIRLILQKSGRIWRNLFRAEGRPRFVGRRASDKLRRAERLYLAGERVPRGLYQVVGSWRKVWLKRSACLPSSGDGLPLCYRRVYSQG